MLRVILISLMMFAAAPASADKFDDAYSAYKRGDYSTALRLRRLAAEQGNASAQHNLGAMYDKGRGVPQDYAEAAKWFRLAAKQGNAKPRITSAQCTTRVMASCRTTSQPTCGSTLLAQTVVNMVLRTATGLQKT
jgi:TPR repeat protein